MRLLVLAPHPDDELLGCAALIMNTLNQGGVVKVVVITNGGLGGDPQIRQQELQAGLAVLQAPPAQCWEHQDGALPLNQAIQERYRALVSAYHPTDIALPAPSESHPDHRRLTRGVVAALTQHWSGELWFYETTSPLPYPNHIEPLLLERKLQALACHASQQAQYDYQAHTQGLATLRGAAIAAPHGEAYVRYMWDGSEQNFFENRPLVSVVVRADDPALLAVALLSLAEQSYDQLEVVVVWHGSTWPTEGPTTVPIRVVQGPGPRAANLNAGIAAAQGEYLAFLDQDDVWLPDHLALLVTELEAAPLLDLAYGDYRLATCDYQKGKVQVLDTGEPLGQDWRAGRLLAGNHIPLHSYVCRTRLAQRLRFDEALEAYEDWDFLVRAELEGCTFRRVPELVCEYRQYPKPGEKADLQTQHERKGYLVWRQAVLRKIVERLSLASLERLVNLVDALESERNTAQKRAQEHATQAQRSQQALQHGQNTLTQLHRWADLLAPGSIASSSLSRLVGQAFQAGPTFAIILPVCDPAPEFLTEAVHSVLQQTYPHWQLCIADDASTHPPVLALLEQLKNLAAQDPRLRIQHRPQRGGIVAASQTAIALAQADWVAFLDHDDRLDPDALLEMAGCIRSHPDLECLYTDSRMIDRNGALLHTYHKPDWAPETLLHLNYINHLTAVRHDVLTQVGGLREGLDGSQDWDLWLRLAARPQLQVRHIALPLYDWRATETSVAYAVSAKPYVLEAACRSVSLHLQNQGLQHVHSQPAKQGAGLRHQWEAPLEPLTVVILTHHNPEDLARLLTSLQQQDYPSLQVLLVCNNVSADDHATAQLVALAQHQTGWRVLYDNRPFNWAALNNTAARHAITPWLLFLNDDVELKAPTTLTQLARYLTLDTGIGIVGARLEYDPQDGGGLQHDGIATDVGWGARNIVDERDGKGLNIPRNVSAVTGACLLTRRTVFDACGGFDERFAVSFNDVDFNLHVRQLGWRVVQASDVTCIHRESRTRGVMNTDAQRTQLQQESQLLRDKWKDFLQETYRLHYQMRYAGTHIIAMNHD
ncbi:MULTISPECIES: glycosyltransferase [Giesbergeria]|uniref:Glycosyltransferase n=1 Tax=Giesbergeria sinuosa TaxID=80883 RepID=A0ABV9QC84_9BURK